MRAHGVAQGRTKGIVEVAAVAFSECSVYESARPLTESASMVLAVELEAGLEDANTLDRFPPNVEVGAHLDRVSGLAP